MRRCARCLLPETQETLSFDSEGICNVCRQHEYKHDQIKWDEKKKEFAAIVDEYRGKHEYDCIVPFSGGKDSTFTLYYLVRELHLKPLVVSFDHGFYRPNMEKNIVRTLKKLGVDYLRFRPNWHVVQKLMLEALIRKGDFCWHCHTGIFSYPMHVAIKYNIPLLIWGEPSAEYTSYYHYDESEEVDEVRFNRFVNLGITADDMLGMLNDPDIAARDLAPFRYPEEKELRRIKCRSICLGSYMPWDTKKQSEIIAKELGWQGDSVEGIPGEYYYEKIECGMQGVRDYLKFLKRGFGRTAHLVSLDLRNGRITKERAQELIGKYDGKRPASLDVFLEYIGIDEEEFLNIVAKHVVAPQVWDREAVKNLPRGEKLHDMDEWDRSKPGKTEDVA